MREFKSLNPKNLPDGFDLEVHTEEPVVEVKESKGKITIDYAFPGFYLVDDSGKVDRKRMELKQIHIKSTGFLTESGKPLLPSFGRYVQIPHNCGFKVTIQKSKPIQFDNVPVSPAQTRLSDSPDKKHEFEYDREFYTKDMLYPEDIVKVTGPFIIDQYNSLLVHVTPIQYNPAKKKIIGYGNITVIISLKEKTGDDSKRTTGSIIDNEGFGNLLLNPGLRIAERVGFKIHPMIFKVTGPTLLIIYAKIFEKAALKLADWKNHRGLLTKTVCIDTIVNISDADFVKKLKAYIRGQRGILFTRLRYVLLFGDTDMIKPETGLSSLYGPGAGTSDYYYSTKYDKDNPDPNSPNSILFFPWLSIGRIPVRPDIEGPPASGDSKAQGVVDQIIAYEKNPPADPTYYTRQVFAAAFEDDSSPLDHRDDRGYLRTIEEIRTAIASLGYTTERVYVSNDPNLKYYDDGTTIPADVKAAVVTAATGTQMLVDATMDGQLYFGHRDHGNWDGWVNPSFRNSDLDNVTGNMPSIFYSINCQTGRYDYPEPTECFAEKNLRMKGTAPSLIAATRNSGTYLNNDLIRATFDATFGGVLPTFPGGNASYPVKNNRLGDVLNYGKSYLPVANSGDPTGVRDHFQIYHVIGDPTLELWKDLPLVVTIKAKIIKKALDIRLSTCPSGAVITIWYGTKMLKRMEATSNHITIPFTGIVPIPLPGPIFPKPALMVCFWAPGYRYTAVKVAIP
jgi:hypothetical protein